MIYLKTEEDLKYIRKACEIWKKVRHELVKYVRVGISTHELDLKAKEIIESLGAKCTFHKLYDFPGYICISVNDQLIHGIGDEYKLCSNDLVTFDIGITYHDHVADAAFTIIVSPSDNQQACDILKATYASLMESIKIIKPGIHVGDIAAKTYEVAKSYGYEVIRNFAGHGCGNKAHEDPLIPNIGLPNTGVSLVPNMVICIEPMLMTKSHAYEINYNNNWTVSSKNHKLTCHYEHMVLVTNDGYEILTKTLDENQDILLKY